MVNNTITNIVVNKLFSVSQNIYPKNVLSIIGATNFLPASLKYPAAIVTVAWDVQLNFCNDKSCNCMTTPLLQELSIDGVIFLVSNLLLSNMLVATGINLGLGALYNSFIKNHDSNEKVSSTKASTIVDYSMITKEIAKLIGEYKQHTHDDLDE